LRRNQFSNRLPPLGDHDPLDLAAGQLVEDAKAFRVAVIVSVAGMALVTALSDDWSHGLVACPVQARRAP
jgi:hypothetical protein